MAKYATVNGAWPEGTNDGRDLKPTPQEAMAAAKRLYKFAMKRPFQGKIKLATGNRYTGIRRGVLYVNPDQGASWRSYKGGWHELVHDLSHYCAYRLYPGKKPHGPQHAFLEKEMISHVVNSGWLEGKLKRAEKAKPPVQTVRAARVEQQLKAWRTKLKRAQNAIKKLERKRRYYERRSVGQEVVTEL